MGERALLIDIYWLSGPDEIVFQKTFYVLVSVTLAPPVS